MCTYASNIYMYTFIHIYLNVHVPACFLVASFRAVPDSQNRHVVSFVLVPFFLETCFFRVFYRGEICRQAYRRKFDAGLEVWTMVSGVCRE